MERDEERCKNANGKNDLEVSALGFGYMKEELSEIVEKECRCQRRMMR
jgi:hypothetical protein